MGLLKRLRDKYPQLRIDLKPKYYIFYGSNVYFGVENGTLFYDQIEAEEFALSKVKRYSLSFAYVIDLNEKNKWTIQYNGSSWLTAERKSLSDEDITKVKKDIKIFKLKLWN